MNNRLLKFIYPLIFIIIFVVSVATRLNKISINPPALFSDEVDAAYQAFVFNNCQSDYNGRKFPVHFKSNSDYRTPAMIYIIALAQKVFGINNFSVRFPSLLFGILTPLIFYLIGKHLLNKKFALILFMVSAINPWLIHYSRAAFEVSGMIFLILTSIYFWLKYIKSKKLTQLTLSIICLVFSTYFYSTAKLYAIFIFFIYLAISLKTIKKHHFLNLLISITILTFISLPMLWSTFKGEAGYRFSYINIFSEPTLATQVDYYRYLDIKTDDQQLDVKTPLASKMFHNKYLSIFDKFIKNYFSSLSTDFLFNQGDSNIRHGFRQFGYFYPIELLFLITGLLISYKKRSLQTISKFFFVILILSPIPYSLTRDSLGPHATRLIIMTIPLIFFISQGIYFLTQKLSLFCKLTLLAIYIFFFLNFNHYYFHNYPHLSANAWHTGIVKAIKVSDQLNGDYSSVYLSDKYEPNLIFYLYHKQIVPEINCDIDKTYPFIDQKDFSGRIVNQKTHIGHIDWSKMADGFPSNNKNLYIVPESEINTVVDSIKPLVIKTLFSTQNTFESEVKFVFFLFQENKNSI